MLPKHIYHYSPRDEVKLRPEFYNKYREHWPEEGAMKPIGLWVSIEDEGSDTTWFEWCKAEQFRLESLRYKYKVEIKEDAKILWLRSVPEIVAFSSLYAANDPMDFERYICRGRNNPYIYMISWKKVKQLYDGIIISPYQWDLRFSSVASWYYPWDCASGCIWNLEKVSLTLESVIDIDSIKDKEESEETEVEESAKDLQWANLGQST